LPASSFRFGLMDGEAVEVKVEAAG
jgi:hypothetical protein